MNEPCKTEKFKIHFNAIAGQCKLNCHCKVNCQLFLSKPTHKMNGRYVVKNRFQNLAAHSLKNPGVYTTGTSNQAIC